MNVLCILLFSAGMGEEGLVGVTTASMDEGEEGEEGMAGGGATALAEEEVTQVVMVVTMVTKEVEAMVVATRIGGETN